LAASVPNIVLSTATTAPTLTLFIKASMSPGLLTIFSYHSKVKPLSGKAT
jgi:hypothetical protein